MKFNLVDGYIKFLTHTVSFERTREVYDPETKEYKDEVFTVSKDFYSAEDKDTYLQYLQEGAPYEIESTITTHDTPSEELLQRCEGRKFNTRQEANDFVENGEKLDEITELQLAMAELYEIVIGGGIDG